EATRPLWNQHAYHITNINDDGAIPEVELNSWEIYNNYRRNRQTTGTILDPPTITVGVTSDSIPAETSLVLSGRAEAFGALTNRTPNQIIAVTVNGRPVDVL